MYLIETWSFQEDIKDVNDIMNIIDYNNNNNNDSNVWVFIRTSTNVVISLQSTVVVDVVLRCACVATPTGPSVRSGHDDNRRGPVSYTHLTLPTILLV